MVAELSLFQTLKVVTSNLPRRSALETRKAKAKVESEYNFIMTQKAHWCMTVVEDEVKKWNSRAQSAWRDQAGDMEKPLSVEFNGSKYSLWIGHLEGADDNTKEPHYHVLLSCPSGRTATKHKALNIMNSANFKVSGVGNLYCQELQTTVAKYKNYIFKSATKAKFNSVDSIIKTVAERLKKSSNITKDLLRKELIDEQGPSWYSKHKQVVETYVGAIDNFQTQRIVDIEEDMDEIVERTGKIIETFYEIILRNVEQHGYDTTHEFFRRVEPETMAKYITIISLLPYLFQRNAARMDNIPGIYFYGDAGAGKSMIFTMGKSYKMIASDAVGISKFKLDGCQSAFLLDDVKANTINDQAYMSTLRQLVLGGYSRIKTHSDTQQVKGFIAVTSNEVPSFLAPDQGEEAKINAEAWRRRFITLRMKYKNLRDFDRQGNEFDYTESLKVIAEWIRDTYKTLLLENDDNDGRYFKMINTITPYYNSLYKYIGPDSDTVVSNKESESLVGSQLLEKEEVDRFLANNPEFFDDSTNDATVASTSTGTKRKSFFELFKERKKKKPTIDGLVIDVTTDDTSREEESRDSKGTVLEEGEWTQSQKEDGEWTQTQSKNYNEDAFMR